MRIAICSMGLLTTTLLVGCGQTGNLQLPNDPNYDKRAQYLLYKDGEKSVNAQQIDASQTTEKTSSEKADLEKSGSEQADKQAAASEIVETN